MTFQRSNEKIPGKIVPTLDKLYDEFRTFGAFLNEKIEKLQNTVAGQPNTDDYELTYMSNLWECVRSAADVVSTASTTFIADTSDRTSVNYGSEFGDVFPRDLNEPILRWFHSNSVYGYDDADVPLSASSEAQAEHESTEYQSDSDSEIEIDMIRSLFKEGQKLKEQGDLNNATRHFRNCLALLSTHAIYSSVSSPRLVKLRGVTKVELLELLIDSYCLMGSWNDAKTTMVEKLSIVERHEGQKNELYLKDTMKLAGLMMKNNEYAEAHLQARRTLKDFKKLGEPGHEGYEVCLRFLIRLCKLDNKMHEEEGYSALLASHKREIRESILTPKAKVQSFDNPMLQHKSSSSLTLSDGDDNQAGYDISARTDRSMKLSPGITRSNSPSPDGYRRALLEDWLNGVEFMTRPKGNAQLIQDLEERSQFRFPFETSSLPGSSLGILSSQRESSRVDGEDTVAFEDQMRTSVSQGNLRKLQRQSSAAIPNIRISVTDSDNSAVRTDDKEFMAPSTT